MSIKYLYEYGYDVYSQNGEDGINEFLLNHLELASGVVLEIGAWDGFYFSNTANLWSNNVKYKGILIESTDRLNKQSLENKYSNIFCYNVLANANNTLEKLIEESNYVLNDNFILASIDVDGDDLNVTKSLGKFKPIILIVEPNGDIINKNNPEGHTVKNLIDMGDELGYTFLGMSGYPNKHSGNVYLIRNDYKNYFDITTLPWYERGILCPQGVIYTH
jgi:hypothetical protein